MKTRKKKVSRRSKLRRSDSKKLNADYQLLEDRRMLATFNVTNTDLSGPGSLPQAIIDSNNAPGADAIDISSGLGAILLTDQLSVSDSVTIQGNGNTIVGRSFVVGSTGPMGIFEVLLGATQFNLNDLTLTGGGSYSLNGGAIRATSATTAISITDSVLSDNRGSLGGAIFAEGSVTVSNSQIIGNEAVLEGGGIFARGEVTLSNSVVAENNVRRERGNTVVIGGTGAGGGISADGVVRVTGGTISGNSVTGSFDVSGGGIAGGSSVILTSSTVSGNDSTRNLFVTEIAQYTGGGGIAAVGDVTLTNSVVSGNTTTDGIEDGNRLNGNRVYGGGIIAGGVVALTDSVVSGNVSAGEGGGIFSNAGNVELSNSLVSGNTASGNGGGIYSLDGVVTLANGSTINRNTSDENGGGIYSDDGNVVLTDSTVSLNFGSGSGGGIAANFGSVTLTNSLVRGNFTSNSGGGIYSDIGAVTLINSTVTSNVAVESGGGIYTEDANEVTLINSTVLMNAAAYGTGGGIHSDEGFVTLTGSSVTGNYGVSGGGIFTALGASLTNSNVTGNSTTGNGTQTSGSSSQFGRGGGIYSDGGPVTLVDSTVAQNSTVGNLADGGGIFSGGINDPGFGEVTLINSTVSGNSTAGTFAQGGGIYAGGAVVSTNSTISGNSTAGASARGGGIFAVGTTVTLNNSTVFANSSGGTGGGVGFFTTFTGQVLTIRNTIIAGNSDVGSAPDFIAPDSLSVQNSIVGTVPAGLTLVGGSNLAGSIANPLDPQLNPLADNGGPTQTHAPLAGSPAINAGNNTLAVDSNGNPLQTDQRGFNRIALGTVDIGAFEFFSVQALLLGDVDQNGVVNFLDIAPFISALSANQFQTAADVNQDGLVNFLDISPFIAILSSQGSVTSSQFLAAPSEPSHLAFVSGRQVQNEADSGDFKNATTVSNSEPVATVLPTSPESTVVTSSQFLAAPSEPSHLAFVSGRQVQNEADSGDFKNATTVSNSEPVATVLPTSPESTVVTSLEIFAAPSVPSHLAFVRGKQVRNLKNAIPVSNSTPVAITLSNEQTASQTSSLLETSPEWAVMTSTSNLFDTQPELLDELLDGELDEAFSGLPAPQFG